MTADARTKLLIVDDLPENLLALEALIRNDDREVFQASSGDEALALLLQHDFALAILDVQMPGMNGFELAELMRGTEKTRHIPIVFVTAAGRELNYAFKGYESGAVDFLYKPLDGFAVASKVRVFVDLHQQRQETRRQVTALEEARRQQQVLLGELQATKGELQLALRMRDDFMSMVAHELRTPLGVLSLELEIRQQRLTEGKMAFFEPERLARMIAKDRRQVRSMTRLIEDMLDVSRIQNGKLSIRPAPTDLSQMLDRVIGDFSSLVTNSVLTLAAQPGVTGVWDEFRLEQVVANLLTNALRYGGGKPIEVTLTTTDTHAMLSVRDQGIGIAPKEQQRIFEQFVRVADGAVLNGLGLGLYISRQLVEAHQGEIRVESKLGEGSVFTVVLPLAQEAPAR
jgi:signal transduction histidine kinase